MNVKIDCETYLRPTINRINALSKDLEHLCGVERPHYDALVTIIQASSKLYSLTREMSSALKSVNKDAEDLRREAVHMENVRKFEEGLRNEADNN